MTSDINKYHGSVLGQISEDNPHLKHVCARVFVYIHVHVYQMEAPR